MKKTTYLVIASTFAYFSDSTFYNIKSYSKAYFEYPCKISHDSKNILMLYTFKNCNVQIKYLAAQLSPNVVQFFEF